MLSLSPNSSKQFMQDESSNAFSKIGSQANSMVNQSNKFEEPATKEQRNDNNDPLQSPNETARLQAEKFSSDNENKIPFAFPDSQQNDEQPRVNLQTQQQIKKKRSSSRIIIPENLKKKLEPLFVKKNVVRPEIHLNPEQQVEYDRMLQEKIQKEGKFQKMRRGQSRRLTSNKAKLLITISHVKKMGQIFMDLLRFQTIHHVSPLQLSIIGDKAYVKKEPKLSLNEGIINSISNLPVFHPNSYPIQFQEITYAIILMISLIYYPVRISFHKFLGQKLIVLRYILIVLVGLNISVKFNCGKYINGKYFKDRRVLITQYLKSSFFFDFFGFLIEFTSNGSWALFYMICMLIIRKTQISIIIDKVDYKYQIQQRFLTITNIVKLLSLIFVLAHYCANCFYEISSYQASIGNEETWIVAKGLQNKAGFEIYINSLYFSFITMITVGYGDITPINFKEKIYVIFMTIVSCGVFAYAVNTVGQIFSEIANRNVDFNKKKYIIRKFMNNRNIKNDIQISIIKYLEFQNTKEKERNEYNQVEDILQNLSADLRKSVCNDYYGAILKKFSVFKDNFSEKFLAFLATKMKEIKLAPGDILVSSSQTDEDSLYYINDGLLKQRIIINEKANPFGFVKKGDFIGKMNLFNENSPVIKMKCVQLSHIIILKKSDFLQAVSQFQYDFESYKMLQEKINMECKYAGQKCASCNHLTHDTLKCHLITYRPLKPLILGRYNFSKDQERQGMERFHKKRFRTLSELAKIRDNLREKKSDLILDINPNLEEICDQALDEVHDHDFYLSLPTIQKEGETLQIVEEDQAVIEIIKEAYEAQECDQSTEFDDTILDDQEFKALDGQFSNEGQQQSVNFLNTVSYNNSSSFKKENKKKYHAEITQEHLKQLQNQQAQLKEPIHKRIDQFESIDEMQEFQKTKSDIESNEKEVLNKSPDSQNQIEEDSMSQSQEQGNEHYQQQQAQDSDASDLSQDKDVKSSNSNHEITEKEVEARQLRNQMQKSCENQQKLSHTKIDNQIAQDNQILPAVQIKSTDAATSQEMQQNTNEKANVGTSDQDSQKINQTPQTNTAKEQSRITKEDLSHSPNISPYSNPSIQKIKGIRFNPIIKFKKESIIQGKQILKQPRNYFEGLKPTMKATNNVSKHSNLCKPETRKTLKVEAHTVQNQCYKEEDLTIVSGFDKMYEFRRYHPNFNFTIILQSLDRVYLGNYSKFNLQKVRNTIKNVAITDLKKRFHFQSISSKQKIEKSQSFHSKGNSEAQQQQQSQQVSLEKQEDSVQ